MGAARPKPTDLLEVSLTILEYEAYPPREGMNLFTTSDVTLMAFLWHKKEYPVAVRTAGKSPTGVTFHEADYKSTWEFRQYVDMYYGYTPSSELPARKLGELRVMVKGYLRENSTGVA